MTPRMVSVFIVRASAARWVAPVSGATRASC
jgi:hypothetical protein